MPANPHDPPVQTPAPRTLKDYTAHLPGCASRSCAACPQADYSHMFVAKPCTCGLDALLASSVAPEVEQARTQVWDAIFDWDVRGTATDLDLERAVTVALESYRAAALAQGRAEQAQEVERLKIVVREQAALYRRLEETTLDAFSRVEAAEATLSEQADEIARLKDETILLNGVVEAGAILLNKSREEVTRLSSLLAQREKES